MFYRLLRNNKESGPFTALQIKEMGLKPYDLLWTEGKGAAWQYASEIPELKDFAPLIEEQPFDRFNKHKEALQTTQEPVVAFKKTKPRFRISNGQLIMIEPGNMEVATNGVIKETASTRLTKETPARVIEEKIAATPEWQDMYSEWQQPQKKLTKEEPAEIETKYSESLDDLKKRYAQKVLNEKGAKSSSLSPASMKQNITAGVALLVLLVGGYVGYTLKQKEASTKTENIALVERADIAGNNNLISQPASDVAGNKKADQAGNTPNILGKDNEQTKAVKPVTQKSADNTKQSAASQNNEATVNAKTTDAVSKPADKISIANDKKKESVKTENNTVANNKSVVESAISSVKNTSLIAVPAPVETKPVAKQNTEKKIDDYISVKRLGWSNTVQNVRLLVNNVSDFPIDLAVINIQYFDGKGKFQKGETMYVKNIAGGNNVEVRVPDSDKSASIKYKVSMVSADEKTLYLVAD